MEFLKKIFEDEINIDGIVEIIDFKFERSQILRELEPDSYDIAFDDWYEERKKRLILKANDIIGLYDNETRFEKLKESYNANSVMPFIGAGMSIPSNYSGWTDFLEKLVVAHDIDESKFSDFMSKGKYEESAQLLYNDLGPELFNERIENEYSSVKDIKGAINYLPLLFKKSSIITTNFDNILERLYEDCDNSFEHIKSGRQLDEVLRQIASGSIFLIKIHGDCKQISDRVLTLDEYKSAYNENSVLDKFFSRFLYKGTLLFLGCSLNSDRTFKLMKELTQKEGAETLPRHYAFIEEIKDKNVRSRRTKDLAKANIFPIWYPEGDHDESIEALFVKLKEN